MNTLPVQPGAIPEDGGTPRHAATVSGPYESVAEYWNEHIHDLAIARHEIGTREFFDELDDYRFDKLRYLPGLVGFSGFAGRELLEVGCGIGIDLVRFARGGALVTGIDLASRSIELADRNMSQHGQSADLLVMNGEAMTFPSNRFDVVYAHGVLQYTPDPRRMVEEIHRVLKPGGQAIMMVYNRHSWLRMMSLVTQVRLEHDDAPNWRAFTRGELRDMLRPFESSTIVPERFPVPTKLHRGPKAVLYNRVFVGAFNLLPKFLVRWSGWHLMAFANKSML